MRSFILIFIIVTVGTSTATDNRIVGGRPAVEGEFPYQVSLRRSFNDKHFCGGSIIAPKHVLTAAHCMYYVWGGILPPSLISVVGGQLNLTMTENSVFRNVSKITIHPGFNKTAMTNDVAIIELTQEFPILSNHFISIVPLRSDNISEGSCIVSGWGVQEFESLNVSEILLAAEVDLINNQKCDDLYGTDVIHKEMLCAGVDDGSKDACQGDSGGPLLCNGFLTGVVSTGRGCGNPEYPGIYANIAVLFPWIQENIVTKTTTTELDNKIQTEPTKTSTESVPITSTFVSTTITLENKNKYDPNHSVIININHSVLFIACICFYFMY